MDVNQTPSFISNQIEEAEYFFSDLNPQPSERLFVTCCGWEKCRKDYQIKRNGFLYFAIEYVTSGELIYTVDSKSTILQPGSLFCYTPESAFEIEVNGDFPVTKYFIDFAGIAAPEILHASLLEPGVPRSVTSIQRMSTLMDEVIQCREYSRKAAADMSIKFLELISIYLSDQTSPYGLKKDQKQETYERVKAYILGNYREIQTMKQVADVCHIDPAYLSRLFRAVSGESPFRYLTRLKLETAAEMLWQANWPVKRVASSVGYADPLHFSRLFKKHFGVSPREFR